MTHRVPHELYIAVAAVRSIAGLPVVAATDPAAIAASHDPKVQRLAAAVQRQTDHTCSLSPEQIEKLRGFLPYPHDDSSAAA